MYYVYRLIHEGETLYIGRSKQPSIRYKQHLKGIASKPSLLYDHCRLNNIVPTMIIDREFKTLADSKRWEMYLILKDYFTVGKLHQHIPNIHR